MRVSTIEGDSGYTVDAWAYVVYLDGVKLTDCFTADEEKGEAHCYCVDSDSGLVVDGVILKTGNVVLKTVETEGK